MAVTTNRIGEHDFIALLGEIVLPQEQISVDARPGVDGVELVQEGKRGAPFQLLSLVDAEDYASAWQTAKDYQELVGGEAVTLTVGGVNSTSLGYKVSVLRVTPRRVKAIGTAIGGLNPPSRGWLEAIWDLIAIEIPEGE